MNKLCLEKVTLLIVDCVDVNRAVESVETCKFYAEFKNIKLLTSIRTCYEHCIEIEPINSRREYSRFILKKSINYVDTEYMLIIQHDGFILNPLSWDDEFYKCDYIGSKITTKSSCWKNKNLLVGNGGFSLRSSRLMDYISKTCNTSDPSTGLEDFYICNQRYDDILKNNFYIPNDNHDLVNKFSVEGIRNKWNGSFGFHNTDISLWKSPIRK